MNSYRYNLLFPSSFKIEKQNLDEFLKQIVKREQIENISQGPLWQFGKSKLFLKDQIVKLI